MTRGALVDLSTNTAIQILDAASDTNFTYIGTDESGWIAFIADSFVQVGDVWNGNNFIYTHIPSVSPLQARLAIDAAGLRDQIEAAVASANQSVKDMWLFSPTIDRTNPLLISIAQGLGLTSQQLDNLFLLASTM